MGKAVRKKISSIISVVTILCIFSIFFSLSPAYGQTGSISGTVTDSEDNPIAGISVGAFTGVSPGSYSAITDASGAYTISGLPAGSYYVGASPSAGQNYVSEYYDDELSILYADPVTVSAGMTATGIDFQLDTGGSISGTVFKEGDPATPIAGVMVSAYSPTIIGPLSMAITDDSGEYTLIGLPAGSLYIRAYAYGQNYIAEYYNDKASSSEADLITVAAGEVITIDFELEPGGYISGTVTDSRGQGISGISVRVYSDKCFGNFLSSATTDGSGIYTVMGLPAGEVYVQAANSPFSSVTYISEWYDDALNCEDADHVTVVAEEYTEDINFQLEMAGSISGYVYENDGITPVADAPVFALYEPCGGMMMNDLQIINAGFTDETGAYTISGLPAGDVYILARPMVAFDPSAPTKPAYIREWYDNAYSCEEAIPVTVIGGADKGGIDFRLEPSTDSDGDDMPDLWEMYYFGDTATSDGTADSDSDGTRDAMEYMDGTAPKEPYAAPEADNNNPIDGDDGGGGCYIATAANGSPVSGLSRAVLKHGFLSGLIFMLFGGCVLIGILRLGRKVHKSGSYPIS